VIDQELAEKIVGFLNDVAKTDPEALASMLHSRFACNKALAEHPTIQVGGMADSYDVGVLGLLNGLCGVFDDGPRQGWGAIAGIFDYDESGKTIPKLLGFKILKNEVE
jgi:hypothetical protein